MAVLLCSLILFIFTCHSLGLNETASVERRDRSLYTQQSFFYPGYFGTHLVPPEYYGAPGYFRAPVEYQPPLGNPSPNPYEELTRRILFNKFFGKPSPIKDVIDHAIFNKFFHVPGIKETSNFGDVCQYSSNEYGTCMTKALCWGSGGQIGSKCGFGTFCCSGMMVAQCGAEISFNNTYWSRPRSLDGITDCSATIKLGSKLKADICQIRLDFVDFNIAQPKSGTTTCDSSKFQVFGARNKVPEICGRNSGQHMYLDVSPSSDIKLNFNLDQSDPKRSWKIKITQIPCSSSNLAPNGCLQYFSGPSTSFSSFYSQNVQLGRSDRSKDVFDISVRRYPRQDPVTESTTTTTESTTTSSTTTASTTTPSTTTASTTTPSTTTASTTTPSTTTASTTTPSTTTASTTTPSTTTASTTTPSTTTASTTTPSTTTESTTTPSTTTASTTTSSTTTATSTPTTTTSTSTLTPSTTTSTKPTSTTTSPPKREEGYVYRIIKLGDQEVKICYKKD